MCRSGPKLQTLILLGVFSVVSRRLANRGNGFLLKLKSEMNLFFLSFLERASPEKREKRRKSLLTQTFVRYAFIHFRIRIIIIIRAFRRIFYFLSLSLSTRGLTSRGYNERAPALQAIDVRSLQHGLLATYLRSKMASIVIKAQIKGTQLNFSYILPFTHIGRIPFENNKQLQRKAVC